MGLRGGPAELAGPASTGTLTSVEAVVTGTGGKRADSFRDAPPLTFAQRQGILPPSANTNRMRHRMVLRLFVAASLLAALVVLCPRPGAARGGSRGELGDAPEWRRLAELWQTMIDHSSDAIYNPTAFRDLARTLDTLDVDIPALVKHGLLPAGAGPGLTHLFHTRYQYISERHYTTESQITLTAIESAAATSHWVLELQLAALRRAGAGPEVERKTLEQLRAPILYELSFLEEYERFQDEAEKRRKALADRQAAGENVDFKPFESERHRRTILLVDAYQTRRIPISKSARALMPYIESLTTLPLNPRQTTSAGSGA